MYSGSFRDAKANASSLEGSTLDSAKSRDASVVPQTGQARDLISMWTAPGECNEAADRRHAT
jgi:hypothetical protein